MDARNSETDRPNGKNIRKGEGVRGKGRRGCTTGKRGRRMEG